MQTLELIREAGEAFFMLFFRRVPVLFSGMNRTRNKLD